MFQHKYLILILFVLNGLVAYAHPIKMTVSKLTIDTETKEISYSINLFMDDFQPVLKEHYPYEIWNFNQLTENEIQTLTSFINDYISITINERGVILHQVTVNIVKENVCQVQFKDTLEDIDKIENLSCLNVVLLKDYATQSNIMHVLIDDLDLKTYRLVKGNAYFEMEF